MQKWIYETAYDPSIEELDKLGDEGWELVAISNRSCFYFKRPVEEPKKDS